MVVNSGKEALPGGEGCLGGWPGKTRRGAWELRHVMEGATGGKRVAGRREGTVSAKALWQDLAGPVERRK